MTLSRSMKGSTVVRDVPRLQLADETRSMFSKPLDLFIEDPPFPFGCQICDGVESPDGLLYILQAELEFVVTTLCHQVSILDLRKVQAPSPLARWNLTRPAPSVTKSLKVPLKPRNALAETLASPCVRSLPPPRRWSGEAPMARSF